eukprot:CAMPEP_0182852942 /NCGR_PEP_ID=MMETSP0034_2-20130328/435_1 /TAXON_ID=156128 /ORGANISM="Nephroselmis pyriformis, Strain CCMP717" /LENGTH=221 /DNA_ID=CAMNT_0024983685 /DNA_START=94 /DNA_END=756 /DNA_ORIENTATION=-
MLSGLHILFELNEVANHAPAEVQLEDCIAAVQKAVRGGDGASTSSGSGDDVAAPRGMPSTLEPSHIQAALNLLRAHEIKAASEEGEEETRGDGASVVSKVAEALQRHSAGMDGAGTLEALTSMALLCKGTPSEKLGALFRVADQVQGSKGYLTREDVAVLTRSVLTTLRVAQGSSGQGAVDTVAEEVIVAVIGKGLDVVDPEGHDIITQDLLERSVLLAAP